MDSNMYDLGFITNKKGMMCYDIRNTAQPVWDSRNFENVANRQQLDKNDDLNLNKQLVKIKCFPKGGGQVVGAIDGRCWIKSSPQYFQMINGLVNVKEEQKTSFSFKSHRDEPECQPVNVIAFANNNILATGSPDGSLILWEKDIRKKICVLPEKINSQKKFGNSELVDIDFCRFNSSMM